MIAHVLSSIFTFSCVCLSLLICLHNFSCCTFLLYFSCIPTTILERETYTLFQHTIEYADNVSFFFPFLILVHLLHLVIYWLESSSSQVERLLLLHSFRGTDRRRKQTKQTDSFRQRWATLAYHVCTFPLTVSLFLKSMSDCVSKCVVLLAKYVSL